VTAFLEGRDAGSLQVLKNQMLEASAALAYERAAALRDKLEVLQWLDGHLQRLRDAAKQAFVYAPPSFDGSPLWYLIAEGRVQGVTLAPMDEATRFQANALLNRVYGKKREETTSPTVDEIDGVLLVSAWFRRHALERERTLPPEQALHAVSPQPHL